MEIHGQSRPVVMALVFCCILLLAACSKLTEENYTRIKTGAAYEEVVDIIGKPDSCDTTLGVKTCIWEGSGKQIKVRFAGDAVVMKSSKGLGE